RKLLTSKQIASPERNVVVAIKMTALALLTAGSLLTGGCGRDKRVAAPPENPGVKPVAASDEAADVESTIDSHANDELARQLAETRKENGELRQRLESEAAARASLEERYAALEIELASSVEEVLRSKASLRSVQNRALAISRIAEVRVQMQAVPEAGDPEVAVRLERANEFLSRADTALADGNFSGASYLAELAGDLTRQARMVAEIRSSSLDASEELIPIVPPRSLETLVAANLREAPGTDKPRMGSVGPGVQLLAVARWGEWFQVETDTGDRAWIHESVVR
ncbi:MAG: SH3 domain-containing protein, partial [Vicinamibacteria bacterium]